MIVKLILNRLQMYFRILKLFKGILGSDIKTFQSNSMIELLPQTLEQYKTIAKIIIQEK